jgi:hypothetical protein
LRVAELDCSVGSLRRGGPGLGATFKWHAFKLGTAKTF